MALRQINKNTYRIEIYIGRNSNGKKLRSYHTFKGGKKEAQIYENELKKSIISGKIPSNDKMTYGDFIDIWLKQHVEVNLAPKTIQEYKKMALNIKEKLGFIYLKDLKVLHFVDFYNSLKLEKNGKFLSDITISNYYTLNNTILKYAVKWDYLSINPHEKVDRPKIKRKEAKFYDLEQTKKLINCLNNEPPKYRALILLAIDSGARRSEITGLEWEDINFKNKTININKTTQWINNRLVEGNTKTDKSNRIVQITDTTIEALKEYKTYQKGLKQKLQNKWENSKKVFTTELGGDMNPDTPSKILKAVIKKNKLEHINFHGLRHTSVSLLINSKIPVQVISKRVGHSSSVITQNIYSHVFQQSTDEATQKLNSILSN